MSISTQALKEILKQQQTQFEQSQLRLIETLTQSLKLQPAVGPSAAKSKASIDAIDSAITEFNYDPASGHTFDAWYKRWEDTFQHELGDCDSASKARLLVRKLGASEHKRFTGFILPAKPKDFNFEQTVENLREIFGEHTSLFNTRYNCLKLAKRSSDDYVTFAGIVNQECENFQLKSLTEDQFKCLIFVAGLQSADESDIRTRLLSMLEQEKDIKVKTLTTECQRLINLKHDTAMVQQSTPQPIFIW